MKPLELSFVSILIGTALLLSAESLRAEGNLQLQEIKSSPSPAREQQQHEPKADTNKTNASPSKSGESVGAVGNSIPSPEKDGSKHESQDICDGWFNSLSCQLMKVYNWGTVPDWGLLIVGIITAYYAIRGLHDIKIQAEAARDAAKAALAQSEAIRLSERAYVKISHLPPGIRFNNGYCGARICVKNFGRTPARVTAVVMVIHITDIEDPIPPPLSGTSPFKVAAFLVNNDEFFFTESKQIGPDVTGWLRGGMKRLFLYGYVDYIDQFGQRHRAGYARKYMSVLDDFHQYNSPEEFDERSNIDLLTEPKYNYDRQREIGEGLDWIWDNPSGTI